MFQTRIVITLAAGIAFVAIPAMAQSEREAYRQEVSAQAIGSFASSTTDRGVEQKATHSGGIMGSYRYFFNAHHGVEANYSYALNTQKYGLSTGWLGVQTHSHEISGAYVFRMPLRKITPFALAGAGALVFDPKSYTGASSQARAAFVYGGGLDYDVSRRVFLRAEYRGFVYNSPTYDMNRLSGFDRVTHRAQPSIGFGYRF
jgi:opacity protein-like surface antigen